MFLRKVGFLLFPDAGRFRGTGKFLDCFRDIQGIRGKVGDSVGAEDSSH